MFKFIGLAFLILVFVGCRGVSRCSEDYGDVVLEYFVEVENAGIHGFLSRVEYGDSVAYILGSMHSGRAHWFPLAPVAEDAMARADVFVFEFDLSVMDSPESIEIQQGFWLPGGQTLEDVLPEEVFRHFYEMLGTYPNVSYEMLARFTPARALSLVSLIEGLSLMGVELEYSVDQYVFEFAQARGLPVVGLNDMYSEMQLIFGMPIEVAISAIKDFPDFETFAAEIVYAGVADAYEAQDSARIYEFEIVSLHDAARDSLHGQFFLESVVMARCVIFAEEIERLLMEAEEPTTFFITIGAAHVLKGYIFGLLEGRGLEVVWVY